MKAIKERRKYIVNQDDKKWLPIDRLIPSNKNISVKEYGKLSKYKEIEKKCDTLKLLLYQ